MTNEQYQKIRSQVKCTHCYFCDNRNGLCLKENKSIFIFGKPCTAFEMTACAAWLYDIDTLEDFNYFHEQYRKEQNQ